MFVGGEKRFDSKQNMKYIDTWESLAMEQETTWVI